MTALGTTATAQFAENRPFRAYVTASRRDAVLALDPTSLEVVATIPVGPGLRPGRIVLDPDGVTAAVANGSDAVVSLIDLATRSITRAIAIECPTSGCSLGPVVFSPDGATLYALDAGEQPRVLVIGVESGRTIAQVDLDPTSFVGGAREIVATPDGSTIYALITDGLVAIDAATLEILGEFEGFFRDLAVGPRDSTLYASTASSIVVIDRTTVVDGSLIERGAEHLTVSADGRELFLFCDPPGDGAELVFLDLDTGIVRDTLPFGGPGPAVWDLVGRPDGSSLLLLHGTDQTLVVVDVASATITHALPLEFRPNSLAVADLLGVAYLANLSTSGTEPAVTVVDLSTFESEHLFRPAGPVALAGTPDGNTLYVANEHSHEVAVVDVGSGQVVERIGMTSPQAVAVDAAGTWAYVVGRGDALDRRGAILVIEVDGTRVVENVEIDAGLSAVAVDGRGDRLFVGTRDGRLAGEVIVARTEPVAVQTTVRVGYPVTDLKVTLDGSLAYAGTYNFFLNDITGGVFEVGAASRLARRLTDFGGTRGVALGRDETLVYATQVSYFADSTLVEIEVGEAGPLASVSMAHGPVEVLPGGRYALVAGEWLGDMSVVDLRSLMIARSRRLGAYLTDVAILPEPGANGFVLQGCMPEFFGRNCGVVPGVEVELNPLGRISVTDGDGIFRFEDVPAGFYTLSVSPRCAGADVCYRNTPVLVPRDEIAVIQAMAKCPGDCDGRGEVSISELLTCVGIALDRQSVATCTSCDRDEDGSISVAELVEAVGSLLGGCPASF